MKAIRISEESYKFLYKIAKQEKRSLTATLDLFIEIFKEGQDAELAGKGLSPSEKAKIKD